MKTNDDTRPICNLKYTLWEKNMGDVTVIGSWNMHTGRPALVLVPTQARRSHERITPCMIGIDSAFRWDEHTGDPRYCAQMSMRMALALGLNTANPAAPLLVTHLVREFLGDLLVMPSLPDSEAQVVADAQAVDLETGKTQEVRISDHV